MRLAGQMDGPVGRSVRVTELVSPFQVEDDLNY